MLTVREIEERVPEPLTPDRGICPFCGRMYTAEGLETCRDWLRSLPWRAELEPSPERGRRRRALSSWPELDAKTRLHVLLCEGCGDGRAA